MEACVVGLIGPGRRLLYLVATFGLVERKIRETRRGRNQISLVIGSPASSSLDLPAIFLWDGEISERNDRTIQS
jgi:hypothetical protein